MEHFFDTRDAASVAAANFIEGALKHRLDSSKVASLVVTGGSSPQATYAVLATSNLAWERVHIVLSDERWVPPSHNASNEKMIRESLLVGNAADARLHHFFDVDTSVAGRCSTITNELRDVPRPFATCLLGMGDDGHIASLFADANNFADGIDTNNAQLCIPIDTAASPHKRISLTLTALLQSDEIVLLFFGEAKLDIYRQAKLDATAYPVSRILHQDHVPVSVFWAP